VSSDRVVGGDIADGDIVDGDIVDGDTVDGDTVEVQGTVASYDPDARSGTALLDDGALIVFPPGSVDPSVRILRLGQRVRLGRRPDQPARVVSVEIITIRQPRA
jgi:hypothetical protein